MRHNNGLKKLNRTSAHRKSLLKNMAVSLIKYEQIRTTLAKAKVLRPFVERIITLSKKDDLHTIRKLNSILGDNEIVKKLTGEIGPRSAKRAGGYTRIFKFGFRYGDSAPMGIIELVDKKPTSSDAAKKSKKAEVSDKKPETKPTAKKVEVKKEKKSAPDKKEALAK
jgi:large subunit ribosomal protein L17